MYLLDVGKLHSFVLYSCNLFLSLYVCLHFFLSSCLTLCMDNKRNKRERERKQMCILFRKNRKKESEKKSIHKSLFSYSYMYFFLFLGFTALSAGVVEYTNCISPSNKCPGYDTKPSDGEALVLGLWGMEYPFIAITPSSTLKWSASAY